MQHKQDAKPFYRPDIDGLRGLALWMAVGFHFFPQSVAGGFIGADIFFVLSGFLITDIILRDVRKGQFSFLRFYQRRIRRIFPALILMLCMCVVAGWVWLLALEYLSLGTHVKAGASFFSNYTLRQEVRYFAPGAASQPLLHLWSLAVEEQFYIVWPLLLWLGWRVRWGMRLIVFLMGVGSFAYTVIYGRADLTEIFYLPQGRWWELMMGATLALYRHGKPVTDRKISQLCSAVGAVMLVAAICMITRKTIHPGWWTLLPTVGTALVIVGGQQAWFNRQVLCNRVLVWFGLVSYPLYLWHWPLLVFTRLARCEEPEAWLRWVLIGVSTLLAWLTYRFVETPLRTGRFGNSKALLLIALLGAVGYAGYKVELLGGVPSRAPERNHYVELFDWDNYRHSQQIDKKFGFECDHGYLPKGMIDMTVIGSIAPSCTTRDPAYAHAVMIWGDSHAQQYRYGLKNHLPKDWQILQVATGWCTPEMEEGVASENFCVKANQLAIQTIRQVKPDVVLIAQRKDHDVNAMKSWAEKIKAMGVKKIVFAGPIPEWKPYLNRIVAVRLWENTPERTYFGVNQDILKANRALAAVFPPSDSVVYADIAGALCNEQGCLTYMGGDKTNLTTWDYGHLTPAASDYVATHLLARLIAGENAAPAIAH